MDRVLSASYVNPSGPLDLLRAAHLSRGPVSRSTAILNPPRLRSAACESTKNVKRLTSRTQACVPDRATADPFEGIEKTLLVT